MRLSIAWASMLCVGLWCSMSTGAQAQASRTWVSGVGDDVNPCSRTAPCKTFAGAISKTARNGEINCLDPGGFGAVTIVKSITLDCDEVYASILHSGTNGIIINFNSFDPLDTRKTVRIRNLSFNATDTGITGITILGGSASAESEVFIERCVIDGDFSGVARGISDTRTGGGELSISDTTVRNTGQTGIVIVAGNSSTRLDAVLDNVRVQNANFGFAGAGSARVFINRSVFSGNTQAGIHAEGFLAPIEVNVDGSLTSNNGLGVQVAGGGVTIRLSNTNVAFNTTGVNGATTSFGNNRISGNGSAGTAPTPAGADAPAKGQL